MDQQSSHGDAWSLSTDSLINTLYEHAVSLDDDCSWCALVARLCNAMGASAGGFIRHDLSSRQSMLRHRFNIQQDAIVIRDDAFPSTGRWFNGEMLSREGRVVQCGDQELGLRSPASDRSTRAMQSLLHNICGVVWLKDSQAYLLSLFRPPEAPPFGPREKDLLVQILPHLKRSHSLRDAINRDRLLQESLSLMIDRLPLAFLLVRPSGSVEFSNRLAQSMLARGDGISLSPEGHISTRFPGDTAELKRLIRVTAMRGNGDGNGHRNLNGNGTVNGHGEHFMISRGPGRLPLVCVVHTASELHPMGMGGREAGATVLIKDPSIGSSGDLENFSAVYRLTRAESRLTQLLVDGHGLFEAASKLGITKNTARTHMRNIYSKIGTNRQSDLIRLHGQLRMY
jgi:DNA-binding CsgD family transcriptional regulator